MADCPKVAQTLRRQESMKAHRLHFDTIIKGSIEDLQGAFQGVVSATVKDANGRDLALEMLMTRFGTDLQRSVDRMSHEYMEVTWTKFDTNKDGSLQQSEMRNVVQSLLSEIDRNLPKMVRDAMEPAADNLNEWIESDAMGPMGMGHTAGGMTIALHANVHARVEAAASRLSQLLSLLMKGLLQESVKISDEIFDTVDANKDGKVTKREFSQGFAHAFGAVVDFSKITREVLRQRPALQRSPSMLMDSGVGNLIGSVVIVLAVASAAAMLVKRKH